MQERRTGDAMGTTSRRTVLAAGAGPATASLLPVSIASAAAAAPAKLGLRLPAPSGPFPVGTTDLHLVDRSRADPYVTSQPYRELMVNLTYPASPGGRGPRASWLTPGWATRADETFAFVRVGFATRGGGAIPRRRSRPSSPVVRAVR
ncbi:hypothetical protein [Actinoplanes sp. URMC 104]|uniref:hypothetical protein n=1 Tax=Actinoplanes sp. URMC 104 TaxID=3423409 RepID=UPI003F1E42C6